LFPSSPGRRLGSALLDEQRRADTTNTRLAPVNAGQARGGEESEMRKRKRSSEKSSETKKKRKETTSKKRRKTERKTDAEKRKKSGCKHRE
jgi:hypothetical protein